MKVKRKNLMKYKKILNRLMTVAMLLVIFMNFVSPMINVSYGALGQRWVHNYKNNSDNMFSNVSNAAGNAILSLTTGAIGSALSIVILLVVGILYMLLTMIFSPIFGATTVPGPEDIIFNAVPIFDPNFIAPSTDVNKGLYLFNLSDSSGHPVIRKLVLEFYQTGFVVAGSIFVIGAMIIGIKLAVTSIASEKAYYKEMIGTWIKGLVMLFTVHILITAVFYLNEQIVDALASSVYGPSYSNSSLKFSMNYTVGGPIGKVASSFMSSVGLDTPKVNLTFEGIGGLVGGLILKAMNEGDLIAAITVAALMGQVVSLMVTYFKRVFVCIALAAIAPYVVAVDFIRKLI